MKKSILLVVCALLGVLTASAQQKLVLKVNGVEQAPIEVWRIDEMKFVPSDPVNLTDTPEILDLGLNVRWADRNMGAASPKAAGRLIGWGDTTLTNYSKKLQYFPVENAYLNDITATQYDVASKKWDATWHMPTADDIQELISACNWTFVNDAANDSVGVLGTLKTDMTKTIFFPVTGYRLGEEPTAELTKGYYWTGNLGTSSTAKYYVFDSEAVTPSLAAINRYLGLAIRPVTGRVKVPTQIGTVATTSVEAQRATVTATLTGDLSDVQKIVVSFGTAANNLSTSVEAPEIAGTVTINLTGLTQNTTYYVKVSVQTETGTRESQVYSFKTSELALFPKPTGPVDLGLPSGVKWSPWNMGSSSPMDVPSTDYARYGWGDPTGEVHASYSTYYPISQTSQYQNGGKIDIAGTAYDIATVKWGSGWRLPREADWNELLSKCTAVFGTYTDGSGKTHKGLKITGPNGNFIYLPAAGMKNSQGQLKFDNESSYYWMSTNISRSDIYVVSVLTSYVDLQQSYIFCQVPIRPVYQESGSGGSQGGSTVTKPETTAGKAVKAVDLGLSILWADRNIGAGAEKAQGSFIRWAETSAPDPVDYSDTTYSLYKNDAYVLTGMIPLSESYDAASEQWGGTWRIPTSAEWGELVNNCDWVVEGSGFRIYKKGSTNKSESIYLATTGYKVTDKGSVQTYNADYCKYWTSTLNTHPSLSGSEAYSFSGSPTRGNINATFSSSRYYGMPIRPVRSK